MVNREMLKDAIMLKVKTSPNASAEYDAIVNAMYDRFQTALIENALEVSPVIEELIDQGKLRWFADATTDIVYVPKE